MSAATLVHFGVNLSMALMVFCVALKAGAARLKLRESDPGLLARSLVAMYVVMPLIVVGIAYFLELNHAVEAALILLALSPVPPILPKKEVEAGGSTRYVIGLLAVASLVAIIVVPGGIALIGPIFGQHVMIPVGVTTKVVATSVLLPLLAGLVIARLAPQFAKKVAGPLAIVATVLLVVLFLPILFVARHALLAQFGNFTILAIATFTLVGLAVGHLFGGPVEGDRAALALATATRHPGVALAILHVASPQDPGIGPAVLIYLLVGGIVSLPYAAWRRRVVRACG